MASPLTQDKRIGAFTTPLGKDKLLLVRFEGREELGELFEYSIEALSEEDNLDFDKALGQNCSLTFKNYGTQRHFSGMLVEAEWLGAKDKYYAYRLVLRPTVWLLSRKTDCRIFQHKTAPDIIKKVLEGFTTKFSLNGSHPEREYCVQYRETDLAFITRLMEEEGIYYYFEHTGDNHTMVLVDGPSGHKDVPDLSKVPFVNLGGSDRHDRQHLNLWSAERRYRSGKVTLRDYNFLKPSSDLTGEAKAADAKYSKVQQLEYYDYPGRYKEKKEGEDYAKVRIEADQAKDRRRHAQGDAMSLLPGGLVTLEKHPTKTGENKQYLVVKATHMFEAESYRSGGPGSGTGDIYRGAYEFLPKDVPFRLPMITPRPLIHGVQTAVVTGKSGEEIDVDDLGRIVVQFHWDREGKKDEKSSLRIRVAQCWSGKKWGGQIIPRIGQEVVVEFLEGDPDRPLVIGTVYNKDYELPYELPANKTQSGLKSNSSKGGNGYNEFMFEDLKNSEKIRMHAQKDHEVTILNSETTEIGKDFKSPQGKPSRETTLKNGDDKLTLDKGHQNVKLKMGNQTTNVDLGFISMEAMQKIELTCGQSKITMTPVSIKIESMMIEVHGTAMTTVKGDAMLILKGGITLIN